MKISGFRSPWLWPIVLLISTFAVSILVFGNVSSPLRYGLVFWFLLVCPGMAFVRMLDISDALIKCTLVVALSLGIGTAVSLVVLYTGIWSSNLVFAILVIITLGGVALQIWKYTPTDLSSVVDESG